MKSFFPTRQLIRMSLLISLSIILTRFFSVRIAIGGVEGVRIGFGGLPIILAGVIFGPLAGGIVGATADILGSLINPMGAYMPHFTLTAFLTGFIPGLVTYYIFSRKRNYWTILAAVAIGQIITSLFLVPLFLEQLFGIPFTITLLQRVIGQSIHIPVYAYLIKVLLKFYSVDTVEHNIVGN